MLSPQGRIYILKGLLDFMTIKIRCMQINYWAMSLYTGIMLGVLHFSVFNLHIRKFSQTLAAHVFYWFLA